MNPDQDDRQIDILPLRETAAADAVKRAGMFSRLGNIALGLVVAAMLGGGGFYYGVDFGRRTAPQAEPPLVRADPSPVKEQPEDPGGLEIPFQDRLVFDGVRDPVDDPGEATLAEPAEQPLTGDADAGEGAAGVTEPDEAGVVVVEADRVADAPVFPPPLPEEVVLLATPAADEQEGPIVIAGADTAAAAPAPEPVLRPPPKPAAQVETAAAEPEPAAEPVGEPVQLAAVPAPFRIQVGAYRSEGAALNGWNLIAEAHGELLEGLKPTIVEIDLGPGRGVFHRLQAGPLADRLAASALCDALRAREQGCLVVGP
jgi:cell division septation protein DedD